MNLPSDADGDVLRRLKESGFSFDQEVEIDFNIDFETWPPHKDTMKTLKTKLKDVHISIQEDHIQVTIKDYLTYELVIDLQKILTELAEPYGGYCNSWGLLWNPEITPPSFR
jgi:uncharacterized protein YajQ (UPF0234 family)